MTIVFVHGSGRSGEDAWPKQSELPGAIFPVMPGYGDEDPMATDIHAWVERVLAPVGELHVVAHSYGGLAALVAAELAPRRIRSLTLFEPAAYSFARGMPHVEAAISRLEPAMALAESMSAADYQVAFMRALTGHDIPRPLEPADLLSAERNRLLAAPWNVDLAITALSVVPTQVLTGGWSEEYEEIAAAMVIGGASHIVLGGFGHRVHDHPDATSAILSWIALNP